MLLRAAFLVCCFAGVLSCSGPSDPESELRLTLEKTEGAIEARDLGAVKDAIAEFYGDDLGNDKRELTRYLAGLLLRNQGVHLATRIRELVLEGDDRARVVMIAALASAPIEAVSDLAQLRADVYHLEFRFAFVEGEWQLAHARWRRAGAADLFP